MTTFAEPSKELRIATAKTALQPASPSEIATILAGIVSIFGTPPGWEFGSTLYLEALQHLPRDVLADAARAHIRAAKFFPKPAEILALAEEEMRRRRAALDHAHEDPEWPEWLAKIWGPKPDGPLKRGAFAQQKPNRRTL